MVQNPVPAAPVLESPPSMENAEIDAIIAQESGGNPNAVSKSGAIGLMQIMPETGKWIASQLGDKGFKAEDLYNPEINKRYGTWYYNYLLDQFNGNRELALTAYHSGIGNVKNLLSGTGGKTLKDILDATVTNRYGRQIRLGPQGRAYASSVLNKKKA